jgi:hypothetical protein
MVAEAGDVISRTAKNPPRISVQMDKETQKRLRKYTVDKYNSTHKMSEVVVAALDAYLTKEGY